MSAAKSAGTCSHCGRALPKPFTRRTLDYFIPDVSECIGIVGMVRMGKSMFAKGWAGWLMKRRRPVLAIDYRDEWSVRGLKRKNNSLGPLTHKLTVSQFLQDPEAILTERLALALVPDDVRALPKVKAAGFRQVLQYLRERPDDELHLFWDECGMVAKHLEEELHDIFATWGADGVRRYPISQRWTDFTPSQRAQMTGVVSFRQVKDSDLRFLAMEAGAEFADGVACLEPRHHLYADLTTVRPEQLDALRSAA